MAENTNNNNNNSSSKLNKNVLIEIISGSLSGAITRCIVAPLDVVKIRLQLQRTDSNGNGSSKGVVNYKGVLNTMIRVTKEEGILSLWKGNLSAELLWITYAAVQFSTYNRIVGMIDPNYHKYNKINNEDNGIGSVNGNIGYKPSPMTTMIAGASAGVLSTIVSYPFDIIRTNIVNNHNKTNFYKTYKSIIQRGGHSYLFMGVNSSLFQIVPQMGFQFTFYESFKYISLKYSNMNNNNPINQFLCGLLSGSLSKFLVLPFDVVKKRLQVNGGNDYGMKSCIKDLYHNEGGIKSFFKGGVPSIIKAGLAAALSFTVFEQSKRALILICK